jgi:hypothetical protein
MCETFPDAMVTGYEALVPAMTNDPKDRHVLAAAVRADAAVIVTANLKDFPASALDPYDLYPTQTLRCVREQIAAHRNPAVSIEQFLSAFKKTVPRFASVIREPLLDSRPS